MTFIIKPLVTEKMTKITDKSSVEKTYKVKGEERTKKAECIIASNVNTYKVLNADVMVITENSLKAIDGVLG